MLKIFNFFPLKYIKNSYNYFLYMKTVLHREYNSNIIEQMNIKKYDYYEIYDDSKTYEDKKYDFGKGLKEYYWSKHVSGKSIFAVANRNVTDEYLKTLEKYCPCDNCSKIRNGFLATLWNEGITAFCKYPFGQSYCSCCVGCLKEGKEYYSEENLKIAEENKIE